MIEESFYGGNRAYPYTGKPANTMKYDVAVESVNVPVDENEFSIDPSIATSIFDADHHVFIEVPR